MTTEEVEKIIYDESIASDIADDHCDGARVITTRSPHNAGKPLTSIGRS